MDYRKIIKFGNSSFVVSLPRKWMEKHNLKKGDVLYCEENGNNELTLATKQDDGQNKEQEISVNLEGEDIDSIKRKIVSKYIAGYDIITLVGEKEIKEYEPQLREILNGLMALELIEQTKSKMTAKDFIDTNAVSIPSVIRRIDTLLRSMLEDLRTTYKDDPNNLTRRDKDINKLTTLAMRTIKKTLDRPSLQQKTGIQYTKILNLWSMIYHLELFADELKRVARHLNETKAKKEKVGRVLDVYERVKESYKTVMKAWYGNDDKLAYDLARRMKDLINECRKLGEKEQDVSLAYAIGRLIVMQTFIRNMARSTYE